MSSTAAIARSRADRQAVTTSIRDVAAYLQDHLGQKMTAYLSGLDHPKTVGHWVSGKSEPRDLASTRLRYAYQATRLLTESYGDETARAWFFGSNTYLDDEAPAYLLRHATSLDGLRQIIPAARAFVETAD